MTVGEMEGRMASAEYTEWIAYCRIEYEDFQERVRKSKR